MHEKPLRTHPALHWRGPYQLPAAELDWALAETSALRAREDADKAKKQLERRDRFDGASRS